MDNKLVKFRLCYLDGTCITESVVQLQSPFVVGRDLLSATARPDGGVNVFPSRDISSVGMLVFHPTKGERCGFSLEMEVIE